MQLADLGARGVIARLGLVGRALLYLVFGLLALDVAAGAAGRDDTRGAVERIVGGGWGRTLLVALCVGLAALVAWKALQAITGDRIEGSEPVDRLKFGATAVVDAAALVATGAVLVAEVDSDADDRSSSGGAGGAREEAASHVLDWPAGRVLLVLAGGAIVAYAVYRFVRHSVKGEFTQRIDDQRLEPNARRVIETAGRIGYGALAAMTSVVGGFLITAGVRGSSDEVEGLAGAIQELGRTGPGTVALWFISAGLLMFAAFSAIEAWSRKVA